MKEITVVGETYSRTRTGVPRYKSGAISKRKAGSGENPKSPVAAKRVVVDAQQAMQATESAFRLENVTELWVLCDRGTALNTPANELIWVTTIPELKMELEARFPCPKGFRRLKVYVDQIGVLRRPILDSYGTAASTLVVDAIKAGFDVSGEVRRKEALEKYGYDQAEINYLLNRSSLEVFPLEPPGFVLVNSSATIIYDRAEYQRALKALERSRQRRAKSGTYRERPQVLRLSLLRSFIQQLQRELCEKLHVPTFVHFDGSGGYKIAACTRLLAMLDWRSQVVPGSGYRRLSSYRGILALWADPPSRKRTLGDMERVSVGWGSSSYKDLCGWLDRELEYCRKRKWKFVMVSQPPKAEK